HISHCHLHSFPTRRSSDLFIAISSHPARIPGTLPPLSCRSGSRPICESSICGSLLSMPASGLLHNRSPLKIEARRRRHAQLNLRSEEHTSELQSPCNLVCR